MPLDWKQYFFVLCNPWINEADRYIGPDDHHPEARGEGARLGLATMVAANFTICDAATSSRRWTFGDSRDHDVQSRKNLKNVQTGTVTMKKLVIYVTIILLLLISHGHSMSANRNKRQIVQNGIRVTDLWLKLLFDWFPEYFPGQLMSTPVLFLPQVNL